MCEQEDFWWPSCEQWGGGEVTPVTMCQHTVPFYHCWPSPACATLPVRRGEVTVDSLCASIYGNISYQHIKPSDRTDLNFPQEHCQGCPLTPVRPQIPSFWLLSPLFGKCSLFYWLFWGQWFFWWSASGLNLQKPMGLFLNRNYPRSNPNPCWPNPTAEPIEDKA